jgi:hypothetical protein
VKRAAVAVRSLVSAIAAGIGLEGAFLVAGTGLLAYGSSFVWPFGPYLVVGIMCIIAGISLAIPERRR